MSIENFDTVDAIGVELGTNSVVLTIADDMDWEDERRHLNALQAKFNAYFAFIESGEVFDAYPAARGRRLVIDVVARFAIPRVGLQFLESVSAVASDAEIEVRSRQFRGTA